MIQLQGPTWVGKVSSIQMSVKCDKPISNCYRCSAEAFLKGLFLRPLEI